MDKHSIEFISPTKEQLEIAKLAAPLAKYMFDNTVCGSVIVTMDSVALYREGFTAMYTEDFDKLKSPLDKDRIVLELNNS